MTKEPEEWKVDRTHWPAGPWNDEPDKVQFRTETGLPGLIVRSGSGALCGYVGVPREHPAYEKEYHDVDVDVHGGLTFAAKCHGAICHVPEPGEPDDVWWLGFDCNHWGDYAPPSYDRRGRDDLDARDQYKDLAYVRAEVQQLALQLAVLAVMHPAPLEPSEAEATDG